MCPEGKEFDIAQVIKAEIILRRKKQYATQIRVLEEQDIGSLLAISE